VDLSGGTLDLWPFAPFLGGAITINMAIEVFTHAQVTPRKDQQVSIESPDINVNKSWPSLSAFLQDSDASLRLFQVILSSVAPSYGFHLYSKSESPVGGGLGGSSSLVISILKAFLKWKDEQRSAWDLVHWAHNLEAQMLLKPTGTQDYVPPVLGSGVQAIHYGHDKTWIEALKVDAKAIRDRFSLVYTGRSHNSGINNWDVQKRTIDSDNKTLDILAELKEISGRVYSQLKAPTSLMWDKEFPALLQQETAARIRLSAGFSSPEIEELGEIVLRAGGHAVKICGAGGGGCVMVWSPPDRKKQVEDACRSVKRVQLLNAGPIV